MLIFFHLKQHQAIPSHDTKKKKKQPLLETKNSCRISSATVLLNNIP